MLSFKLTGHAILRSFNRILYGAFETLLMTTSAQASIWASAFLVFDGFEMRVIGRLEQVYR
jgi:hypothetical protein